MTQGRLGAGGKHPDTTDKAKGKFGLIRKPCLSEPGYQQQLEDGQKPGTIYEEAGALCRSYGDEVNSIGTWDGCFSPACQAELRAWLKTQYPSLEALNKEWRTAFKDWNDVVAMTAEEVRGRESFAPWADHRAFNEWNWARSFASIRRGVEKQIPGMRVSISGTQETSAFNAYDWRQLMRSLNALASYGGEQSVQQRSFGKDFLWMPWLGYAAAADEMEGRALNYLFEGATGFNIYSGRFYINPDFSFPPAAQNLRAVMAKLGQGRAEVIISAPLVVSPIAFLYSPASIRVNWITDLFAAQKDSIQGFRAALAQFGCNYDYLAYDQLAAGEAGKKGYRLLVLPGSSALSAAEAEGVRQFVESGGVVLADLPPAAYTEHGRRLPKPQLDDLFGVDAAGGGVASAEALLRGLATAEGVDASGFTVPVQRFAQGLKLAGGKALAEVDSKGQKTPALVVNRFGKGLAVLAACDLFSIYGGWGEMRFIPQRAPAAQAVERITRDVLKAAAVEEGLIPLAEDGSRLRAAKALARVNGPGLIVGVLRDTTAAKNLDPKPHQVTLRLPKPGHICNVLEGSYVGYSGEIKAPMSPETHLVMSVLPYKASILMAMPAADKRQGPVCKQGGQIEVGLIVAADGKAEPATPRCEHTLWAAAFGPDGKERPAYRQLLRAPQGKATLRLRMALNDDPGPWTLEIRDALTGASAKANFQLE
ncbi:MAG TPA: beta-galactosidase trimerization domain-containing protein [Candidatus Brocadiia bacterium]|nr:beta-galactosidase trimerization domain-containing protein [Candidatus Brocadiia bacterium]